MSLQTKNVRTNDENRALRAKFIEEATPILTKYNIPVENFVPKAIFEDNNEKYIKIYPGEVSKGLDLYVELVTLNYEPVLSAEGIREIRKWKYNPHYKDEYRLMTTAIMTGDVYLIPIIELEIISKENKEETTIKTRNIPTLDTLKGKSLNTDAKYSEMTIRDYVAIKYKKPVSQKQWLNNLIEKLDD